MRRLELGYRGLSPQPPTSRFTATCYDSSGRGLPELSVYCYAGTEQLLGKRAAVAWRLGGKKVRGNTASVANAP
jgi:hypothetical protein